VPVPDQRRALLASVLLLGFAVAGPTAASGTRAAAARAVLAIACDGEPGDPARLATALDARVLNSRPEQRHGQDVGWRHHLAPAAGGEAIVVLLAPGGRLQGLSVEVHEAGDGREPRPALLVIGDADCRTRSARGIAYDAAGAAQFLDALDADLETVVAREPVNPPVPPGVDPGGVLVGMVDSGVDYRLSSIAARLARDRSGRLLGYDFWDLDQRPFDADAISPFSVRRHGTRTASILLVEAPGARLVPYRFPRPHMSRMGALVERAAGDGVVVLNLSLGSPDRERWGAFERAARAQPQMLFVVSAGNDGRDIDQVPVYPAALALDNILTVTSSEDDGRYATGSNHGVRHVDVAIPAERKVATEFGGAARLVSGASYAAARVSALAACLLAAHPDWRARELKRAVLERARPTPGRPYTAHGYVPNPSAVDRGSCPAEPTAPEVIAEPVIGDLDAGTVPASGEATHELRPTLVVVEEAGWSLARVEATARRAVRVLRQCAVHSAELRLRRVRVPRNLRYYDRARAAALVDALRPVHPAVFFLADTLERPAFDAVAIGRANAGRRPELEGTVWMTARIEHAGIALAHELVHVLSDSGEHVAAPDNLMRAETRGEGTSLTAAQCGQLRERGTALGLLTPRG
jgi:hypothetical protein